MGGKGKGGFSGRGGFGDGAAEDFGAFWEGVREKSAGDPDEKPAEIGDEVEGGEAGGIAEVAEASGGGGKGGPKSEVQDHGGDCEGSVAEWWRVCESGNEAACEGERFNDGGNDGDEPPVRFACGSFDGEKLGEFHLVEVMKLDD